MKMSLLLFVIALFHIATYSQQYHYPFVYNSTPVNVLDVGFFDELEKDLNRSVTYNATAPEYSYIQHLKNKNVYFSLNSKRVGLNQETDADSLLVLLNEMLLKFPTQTSCYYYLASFYLKKGESEKAIEVMKAAFKYNISPKSFNYLSKLYPGNEKFIQQLNNPDVLYCSAETTIHADNRWVALFDSIIRQDQLYRRLYRYDDPWFEKQIEIDTQNSLLLKELVQEYGWFTKHVGRDYHDTHLPVIHFDIADQLYFLDYIIADCKSYQAKWYEAEQVLWKMVNHQSQIRINNERYHSIPLLYTDSISGFIDLEKSMLALRSAVLAMIGCGAGRSDIWLVATTESASENLGLIKKYFSLLGLNAENIHIQSTILEEKVAEQLILKTPVVIRRK
jgi:tetratricopeptide (TPR) repeat protein